MTSPTRTPIHLLDTLLVLTTIPLLFAIPLTDYPLVYVQEGIPRHFAVPIRPTCEFNSQGGWTPAMIYRYKPKEDSFLFSVKCSDIKITRECFSNFIGQTSYEEIKHDLVKLNTSRTGELKKYISNFTYLDIKNSFETDHWTLKGKDPIICSWMRTVSSSQVETLCALEKIKEPSFIPDKTLECETADTSVTCVFYPDPGYRCGLAMRNIQPGLVNDMRNEVVIPSAEEYMTVTQYTLPCPNHLLRYTSSGDIISISRDSTSTPTFIKQNRNRRSFDIGLSNSLNVHTKGQLDYYLNHLQTVDGHGVVSQVCLELQQEWDLAFHDTSCWKMAKIIIRSPYLVCNWTTEGIVVDTYTPLIIKDSSEISVINHQMVLNRTGHLIEPISGLVIGLNEHYISLPLPLILPTEQGRWYDAGSQTYINGSRTIVDINSRHLNFTSIQEYSFSTSLLRQAQETPLYGARRWENRAVTEDLSLGIWPIWESIYKYWSYLCIPLVLILVVVLYKIGSLLSCLKVGKKDNYEREPFV